MQDLLAQLSESERDELYRCASSAWNKVFKLWTYAQSRAAYAIEDFQGMCFELTEIMDDLNEVEAAQRQVCAIHGYNPCAACAFDVRSYPTVLPRSSWESPTQPGHIITRSGLA